MRYAIIPPAEHLRDLIKCYWILETTTSDVLPDEYQLMADTYSELVFQYGGGFPENSKYDAYIRFQHSETRKIKAGNKFGMVGVRLFPHAIQRFFQLPADEFVNTVCDFKLIVGARLGAIIPQVIDTYEDLDRISLLNDFFSSLLVKGKIDPFYRLVKASMEHNGSMGLDTLLDESKLSVKQIERRYKAIAGFTPKYFSRIIRFKSTKHKYITGSYRTLTELAVDCNYYDQPHFIRDFKEFSGMPAGDYFKLIDVNETLESQVLKDLIIGKDLHQSAFRRNIQDNGFSARSGV
jgi:AraC-like DNA-binding protein